MSEYRKVEYEGLYRLCKQAFEKIGYSGSEADHLVVVLLRSDLRVIERHGLQRLSMYMSGRDMVCIN